MEQLRKQSQFELVVFLSSESNILLIVNFAVLYVVNNCQSVSTDPFPESILDARAGRSVLKAGQLGPQAN